MVVRKVVRALAASAAAVVVLFGVASPAHAEEEAGSTHHAMETQDDNPGGRVDFWTYGDLVQLCDQQEDGMSAFLEVWDSTQDIFKYKLWASPNGRCVDVTAGEGDPYNLKEGNWFQFRVCLSDNGAIQEWTCDYTTWYNG